ncbi:MAG: hypothetical protein FJZ64_03710, partial [Chlamydiae bacterium]|nr:hypothetical protein [Chlamydiota bacterium]
PIRSAFVGAFTPAWRGAEAVKEYLSDRPIGKSETSENSLDLLQLQLENRALKQEVEKLQALLFQQLHPHHQKAVIAPVIYRDPNSWSSSLWIGIGEEENILQNSPVVIGDALIGVVEYVGKHQSRIRLITDANLSPAVRVVRSESPREAAMLIDMLCHKLHGENDLVRSLQTCKEKMNSKKELIYLAKGEVHGNGTPFWKMKKLLLKGSGFNYDTADDYGASRELSTGHLFSGGGEAISLIREGDHLITSGLDGIFPFGLSVGIVTKVFPLQEGSSSYEIEAIPTAFSLNDLKFVFVLPLLET